MPSLASGLDFIDLNFLGRPEIIATAILHGPSGVALIDPGPERTLPTLTSELTRKGIRFEDVRQLLITHIHLDHAGATGSIVEKCPHIEVLVHERGAPHMIDPAKLIAGSKLVYGAARFARLYGELLPIAGERVQVAGDGERVSLGERTLELIHTPGHALHHYALVDPAHASLFSGDTFGISYRALDTAQGNFITPSTVPTQFDPAQHLASIDRMLAWRPESVYLMHFSRVSGVPRLGALLKSQIEELASLARRHAQDPERGARIRADMLALWLRLARAHGVCLPDDEIEHVLSNDLTLNTQGLIAWLDRSPP